MRAIGYMSIRTANCLTIVLLASAASLSCGNKGGENARTTASGSRPSPLPLASGMSQGLTPSASAATYFLDSIGPVDNPAARNSVHVPGEKAIAFTGWAVDAANKGPAAGVDVVIDQIPYSAHYGAPRSDVSQYHKMGAYLNSGFEMTMAPGQLTKGPHTVCLRVISQDRQTYYESPSLSFFVD